MMALRFIKVRGLGFHACWASSKQRDVVADNDMDSVTITKDKEHNSWVMQIWTMI